LSQLVDSPLLTESPDHADEDVATLFDSYGARIRAYCYGQLRDRQEADDAVQSTFLYALTLHRRGETPRRPLPWLYTIAHNVCRTRRRALKRRSSIESNIDLDAVRETVGRTDPPHEDVVHLASSLSELPLSQRTALLLREWQGLSYAEIGMELGLTESAVEAVLFRARRNLAKKLQYVTDRAATVAGAVLLLPSLRRLSSFGPAAKTATAAAVLVGTTALLPFADAPRVTHGAAPRRPRVSSPRALMRPLLKPTAAVAGTHVTPMPIATAVPAAVPSSPPPVPVPVQAPTSTTPAAAPGAPAPVSAMGNPTAPPQAGVESVQTTLATTTNDVVSTAQATAANVKSTIAGATNTVTSTTSTVTGDVTSEVQQLPTVPSPIQSPPENTPLPSLP
jgi:RNA polymerase sigma factor (sigma-70 family)